MASPDINISDTANLLKNSTLYASGSYVLTQHFLTTLRKKKLVEQDMVLYDADGVKEMGQMQLVYKLKI